ncbi:MAG: acyl-CoA dehydrogenase family protein [Micropepsaceae bacterium]
MNETAQLIHDAAHKLFTQHVTPELLLRAEQGEWSEKLWDAIEEAGFLDTFVDDGTPAPERAANTHALLKAAARHLVPVPLGETIIARALLGSRKVRAPAGPLSFAVLDGHTHTHGDHAHLKGLAKRVPYARHTSALLLATMEGQEAVMIATRRGTLVESTNIAGEPRDDISFTDTAGTTVAGISGRDLKLAGATLRSVAMAGALERILMQTVEYARTRVQFGKPIAAFQAIQQQLAVLAGHTAASSMAAEAALASLHDATRRDVDVAVAKIRAGEAVGPATSIAHQVHGAIGITREHSLHFATRRLWSWRAEFGPETEWAEGLGRTAAKSGGAGFWPSVTA